MKSLIGACQCRAVTYRIDGRLVDALYCHCSICRKLHGTAFRARALVRAADFHITAGESELTFYESSPGVRRGFCRVCGSPLMTRYDRKPAHIGLPLGALEGDPGIRATKHVHVASKAPWFTIEDQLAQFAAGPIAERIGARDD